MTERTRVILFWLFCWLIIPYLIIKVFVGVGVEAIKTILEYTHQERSG